MSKAPFLSSGGFLSLAGTPTYICEVMSNSAKEEMVHTGGQRRKDGFWGGVLEWRTGQRLI